MKTSNKVLITSIIAIVSFTVMAFILQFVTGTEVSATLIEYWYKFWTVEIVVLSGIKISKIFKSYHNIENNNNNEDTY